MRKSFLTIILLQIINLCTSQSSINELVEHSFKLTYQFGNSFDVSLADQNEVEIAMQIAIQYLNRLLRVKNQNYTVDSLFPSEEVHLLQFKLLERFSPSNSDLMLIVFFSEIPLQENYLGAHGTPLYYLEGFGPKIASLTVFSKKYKFDRDELLNRKLLFQDIVSAVLNLFKDSRYWINTNTGRHYENPIIVKTDEISRRQYRLLATPNILQTAKEHFNCTELEGVRLSNIPQTHKLWDPEIIKNDYLGDSSYLESKFMSQFTFAFLKDTGYFTSLNETMLQPLSYGKNFGCGQLDYQQRNEESVQCEYKSACNPEGLDQFICYIRTTQSKLESQLANCELSVNEYARYSSEHRCLTIIKITRDQQSLQKGRCVKTKCRLMSKNMRVVVVLFNNRNYYCTFANQLIVIDLETTFRCPQDIDAFCRYKPCKNNCEGNGYCLNGECQCLTQYTGEYCQMLKIQ